MGRMGPALVWGGLLLGMAAGEACAAPAVTAIPKLDREQSKGSWYEIARLPYKREKKCVSDVSALVAEGNSPTQLQVVMTCRLKDNNTDWWDGTFKLDKAVDGNMKITTIWPLSKKYRVMAVGEHYEWALVGTPNHKNLWMMSRQVSIAPEVLEQMKSKAAADGFALDKLVTTVQTGKRATTQAPQPVK